MKAVEERPVLGAIKKGKDKTKSKKWDRFLADYKNYFLEYKRHYKDAQNGDQIALSQYPYMRGKCEVLRELISKAHSNNCLTKKQIKKAVEINPKIVKACF
jgi:hypothetical protein